jgi:hypothetical protein
VPGFTQIPNDEVFNDPLWTSDRFTKGQALVDLYKLAQFQDGITQKRGIIIPLKPGQLGWSLDSLAERWQWSKGKVRRFFHYLKTVGQIELQKTNVSTTITLLHWINNDTANRPADSPQTDPQTARRRYPNNIVNKDNIVNREKSSNAHTQIDLKAFTEEYPTVDVQGSYQKFKLNLQKNNRTNVNEMAEFQIWLIRDKEKGWNKRIKSNNSVTIYCPVCDKEKIVSEGPEARETICECGNQMLRKNDYLHEKERLGQ